MVKGSIQGPAKMSQSSFKSLIRYIFLIRIGKTQLRASGKKFGKQGLFSTAPDYPEGLLLNYLSIMVVQN
jgi:hypothetical protein